MFNIGDLIVYGNTGVCRVIEIGIPPLSGISDGKDYYTLLPYYGRNSRIYTPCDNDKVVMRPVISKAEAEKLIGRIDSIGLLEVPDEKRREEIYKNVMRGCDCVEFISIIKTIYLRKQERIAEGKKITANDEKYFTMAEDKLYGELAVALEIEKSEVKNYIAKVVAG